MTTSDIVIIGGGAAGLMCAITAARRGRSVRVIEHTNRVGKKILMSGGGRCNFTNMYTEPDHFLSANPAFCRSALARYTPWDFVATVERHGIAYHEKELGQLFCDESSKLIVRMLLDDAAEAGVVIDTDTAVTDVSRSAGGFRVDTSRGGFDCASLVVACGGLSIPRMGATGFGYDLARQFGHAIEPTRAALVPLTLSGAPMEAFQDLSGVSVHAGVSSERMRIDNALLLTHRGLSGPAVLQVSSYWREGEALTIDWLPDRDAAAWLIEQKRARPAASIDAVLDESIPRRLSTRLCALKGWHRPLQETADDELRAIGGQLNAWTLRPSGTEGYRTAEVTLGGVDTRQLSSQTMASQLVDGLYFIGEVVDVTGHLGGFNFQWAWASGVAAGQVC